MANTNQVWFLVNITLTRLSATLDIILTKMTKTRHNFDESQKSG